MNSMCPGMPSGRISSGEERPELQHVAGFGPNIEQDRAMRHIDIDNLSEIEI